MKRGEKKTYSFIIPNVGGGWIELTNFFDNSLAEREGGGQTVK